MIEKIRVLIIDDSAVYRSQIRAAIESCGDFEVAAVAANGKIGVQFMQQTKVDIVTLDLEMPEMNGLQTLEEIKRLGLAARVVVFSAHSTRGAEATLAALAKGACDFITKPTATDPKESGAALIARQLIPMLRALKAPAPGRPKAESIPAAPVTRMVDWNSFRPSAIVIGSSTGGPGALEEIFQILRPPLTIPIFIAQHMPSVFTASLATRLSQVSGLDVREGIDGELVQKGRVYVAPGNYHMRLTGSPMKIELTQGPLRNSVRPACDELFETAADLCGASCLTVVLTGMGEDGKLGAVRVRNRGGAVVIQNKESCVVFGMPGAIHSVGAFDRMDDPKSIGALLMRLQNGGLREKAG